MLAVQLGRVAPWQLVGVERRDDGLAVGFIIYDHVHKLPAYLARVAPWFRSGELVFHEDIVIGIENAPAALIGMMKGEAIGKRLVQVAPE